MTKISAYPEVSEATIEDLLIGTDVETQKQTKNFSVKSIVDLIEFPYLYQWIKSDESLSLAKRNGDVLYSILDKYTGEEMTLSKVTGTPVVDGIIYFQLEDEYFKRNFQIIDVKWFGAKGDGVTDDTIALNKWVNSGRNLILTEGVYIVSNSVTIINDYTKIIGTGTIKRANQLNTTTATAITTSTSSTAITVADATGFKVDMFVTVTNGFNNTQGCYKQHRITSIVGKVITVNTTFSKAFPSGGTLVSYHSLLTTYATPESISINGITLDGNKDNNTYYTTWQVNHSLYFSSLNGKASNLKIINSQADGMILGGTNFVLENNLIKNSNGNALHLSGIAGANIINNTFLNANLGNTGNDNTTGSDHSEGLITWSELVSDIIVDDNYFDTGRTIIGGIGGTTNNDIQFINNVCKNATYQGIEFTQSSITPEDGKNIIIANNKFFNCKTLNFNNTNGGGLSETIGVKNIIINANHLIDTQISTNRAKHVIISNNIIEQSVSTVINIEINNFQHFNIFGNTIKGGRYGIYAGSTTLSGLFLVGDQMSMSNNNFFNQVDTSIFFASSLGKQYRYISVEGNNIFNSLTYSSFVGIQGMSGCIIKGNVVNILTNGDGIYVSGDNPSDPIGIQGSIIERNTIIIGGSGNSIRIYGNTSKAVVKGNYLSVNVNNGSPTTNYVSDNYIIGSESNLITENGLRVLFNTLTDNGVDLGQFNGSVLASSFKKKNGLSTESLMADGSTKIFSFVDSANISYGESYMVNHRSRVVDDAGIYNPNSGGYQVGLNKENSINPIFLMLPSGTKISKLYATTPQDGSLDMTVVRGTTATRVDEDLNIKIASINEPRIDYTYGQANIIVEPETTNLSTYSEGDISTYGTAVNVTNASSSFNSFSNAIQFPSTGTSAAYKAITTTVQTYAISAFIKMDDNSVPILSASSATGNVCLIIAGSFVTNNLKVESYGNNVYRLSGTGASAGINGNNGVLRFDTQVLKSFKVTGIQLEAASYPTSYIFTSASPVLRDADVITINPPNGVVNITETFNDDTTNVITVIPSTYQVSNGRIKKIIMT